MVNSHALQKGVPHAPCPPQSPPLNTVFIFYFSTKCSRWGQSCCLDNDLHPCGLGGAKSTQWRNKWLHCPVEKKGSGWGIVRLIDFCFCSSRKWNQCSNMYCKGSVPFVELIVLSDWKTWLKKWFNRFFYCSRKYYWQGATGVSVCAQCVHKRVAI